MDDEFKKIESHNLILENRSKLRLTGVTDVDSFDETTIVAYTELGELNIGGSGLHINKLNTDDGELIVEGRVNSLFYLENQPKSSGVFSRLFK